MAGSIEGLLSFSNSHSHLFSYSHLRIIFHLLNCTTLFSV